jgi:16S rRNA (adenine1518-N6/adenine1519-N6)-dimethyltransferase
MQQFIKPLKSLGQHFLNQPEIAGQIAGALTNEAGYTTILEIGPGTGVLTGELIKSGKNNLFCIEIDERSVALLENTFPSLQGKIIHDDFLSSSLDFIVEESFAVIGNFPYNISSQILFKVLENYTRIPEVVGMFQKEVAMRIASKPGNKNYGILSVLLQAHYNIEYLFTVPPSAFIPPPKVESGVIRMKLKSDHELKCDRIAFKNLVKTAFNQRRKMLRNSIRSFLPEDPTAIPYLNLRPEQLHFTQFVELTNLLFTKH